MTANPTGTDNSTLAELQQSDRFIHRHIGPDTAQIEAMLYKVGAESLQQLIEQTVPASILSSKELPLPDAITEAEALARLRKMASTNQIFRSFIGMGYHDTHVPNVILRNVLENPGWYTAYTPYQPEIAQGRLECLLNFQQMIMDMTGMELANASLLDEGTAAAEAMTLCKRVVRKNPSQTFFVAEDCHPQTVAVIKTRAARYGFDIVVGNPQTDLEANEFFGALLQYPGTFGEVHDLRGQINTIQQKNALAVVAADLMSLVLLKPPGELGADVVVGNTQRFGVPMGFGGPHAAYFATRDQFKRSTPGRIIGVSIDRDGRQALRMAMQTREQHIRREKANSNICTSQALLAIMASFYAIYHGPQGLTTIARRIHRLTGILASGLEQLGWRRSNPYYFDTLTIAVGEQQTKLLQQALAQNINLRQIGDKQLGISLDETTTTAEVQTLLNIFAGNQTPPPVTELDNKAAGSSGIPVELQRTSRFLTHPVFNSHHSETKMLRYIKRLENKDIALNHSMIALGSCTMKLNATAEMIPVSWPEFASMHPFAPLEQAPGYLAMIHELETMLIACTGYDAVSLQPNAGSQGEYAGLLAIRRYHESRGDAHRTVCLIPSSAHGTNPASAVMAGLQVVIICCDNQGNIDFSDLKEKAERYKENLAALMITYPSTHGVFEQNIVEICELIHQYGGQVYMDGANMNAMVGVAAPGKFGADVSHLNLHKTFAIPHGGGGPGMGPIAVGKHLAPFLPNHPVQPIAGLNKDNDTISAATWGSAGILPISWMYITLMGKTGLRKATQVAILNANYIARRLASYYPVLYTGMNDRVAHECIIDLRPLKESSGVTEEDIAKRLIDFGFHAPTMSFPVPGTLMIEPTESEAQEELDRFCDALITIRSEIQDIESGLADPLDNPLKNAPHTLHDIVRDDWSHPYTRQQAAYPLAWLADNKYWPPVSRLDNVYGDRNLFCACPGEDVT